MPTKTLRICLAILAAPPCLPLFPMPAAAQLAAPEAALEEQEISVVGFRNPYKLTVKQLRGAARAYRKGKAVYAPASTLFFQVKTAEAGESLDGVTLTLRAADQSIPVPLDAASRFVLPELGSDDWELVANRSRAGLIVRPVVMSPGTSEADRMLGDMRLQCEVHWAIEKQHMSVFARGAFGAAGGCKSSSFAIYARSDRPIADASVIDGVTSKPVQVLRDGYLFRAPLHDKKLPNSARVRFNFK
jgi:hypothetical protein